MKCLTNRETRICSPRRLDEELDCVRKIFAINGYPPHVVNRTLRNALNPRPWCQCGILSILGPWRNRKPEPPQKLEAVVLCCGSLDVMAQEATSWDPGSIPGRDASFDFLESSGLLSGTWLQLGPDTLEVWKERKRKLSPGHQVEYHA